MKNIFRLKSGQPISQFKDQAVAWDMCLDSIKKTGVFLNEKTWDTDIPNLVRRIRTKERGWLCFIEE